MDLTFDPQSWLRPAHDSAWSDAPGAARPDWHVLAARLAAAHAFQRHGPLSPRDGAVWGASSSPGVAGAVASGSFHRETAQVLTGFVKQDHVGDAALSSPTSDTTPCAVDEARMLADVNPKSSGDRKGASGNNLHGGAGPLLSGNRGLK